ncbi:P-loop containing nucleoside triphosphate hydrolase protein [Polychytrium aggregatum]|uniref:P-loop containing nucleoside triphosphate hydrolase protein n=1 Tax=Polychytrium aggregatum TaxID=110093 RepID=UPI0022FF26C5|nr:P-loop containing nucleoside triphosphate hydrolase protein [Polychytrium aggregatum]KAI9190636.1 P-loop containing nucleoside triphosphate hydrolase protein [Polychytrium aggregatum]
MSQQPLVDPPDLRLAASALVDEEDASQNNPVSDSQTDILSGSRKRKSEDAGHFRSSKKHCEDDESYCGTVERIELVNFMCHKYLVVDFNPKINFVIGHNGSGKSAILTGLMICLGGKASFTNRGQNLKNFIKEGESSAEITVRIRNTGEDAFEPGTYGDFIEITRRLTADSGKPHTYKIMSSNKTLVSTKKEDLVAICDHFQIQVENPLAILTQDTARMFLGNSTPQEKYQLSQLHDDYSIIKQNLQKMRESTQVQVKRILELKDDIVKLKERMKVGSLLYPHLLQQAYWCHGAQYAAVWLTMTLRQDLEQMEDYQDTIHSLKNELIWATIVDQEQALKKQHDAIESRQRKINRREEHVSQNNAELERLNEDIERCREKIESLSSPVFTSRLQELQNERVQIKDELRECLSQNEEVQEEIRKLTAEKNKITAKFAAEKKRLGASGNRAEREQELEDMKERRSEITTKLEEMAAQRDEIDQELERFTQERQDARADQGGLSRKVEDIRKRIETMQQQTQNSVLVYGNAMPKILEEIDRLDRAGRWVGSKPVGPLGLFVKLRDARYGEVIESCLGRTLNGFAISSNRDISTLQGVLRKFRSTTDAAPLPEFSVSPLHWRVALSSDNPIIRYTNARNFDFSSGEPEEKFVTIYRMLEITNPVVLMCLVVNHNIESIALVNSRVEGLDMIAHFNGMPHNVRRIYDRRDLYECGQKGMEGSFALNRWRGAKRLVTNIESDIRAEQDALKESADRLETLNMDITALSVKIDDRQKKRQKLELRRESTNLHRRIDDLQTELSEDSNRGTIHVLQNTLDSLEAKLDESQEKLTIVERQRLDLVAKDTPIKQRIEQLNAENRMHHEQVNKLKRELNAYLESQDQIQGTIATVKEQIEDFSRELENLKSEYDKQSSEIDEAVETALEITQKRITTHKTIEVLQKEISRVAALATEQAKRHGDKEAVSKQYEAKVTQYNRIKKQIKDFKGLQDKIESAVEIRASSLVAFREFIIMRAKLLFQEIMKKRGYDGKLEFRDGGLFLRVSVEDQAKAQSLYSETQSNKSSTSKDPKSLSGGEKSFSTICLLLSIWDGMANPFRCLDEFDVFMDAVNRRISMKFLIDYARSREKQHCQYILITPQDMSYIKGIDSGDVKVSRLEDPSRNGGYRQRTLDEFTV